MTKGRGGGTGKEKSREGRKGNTRAHDWTDHGHGQPGLSLTGTLLGGMWNGPQNCPLGKEDGSTYLLTSFCQPLENLDHFLPPPYYPRPLSFPPSLLTPNVHTHAHLRHFSRCLKEQRPCREATLSSPRTGLPGPAFSPLWLQPS